MNWIRGMNVSDLRYIAEGVLSGRYNAEQLEDIKWCVEQIEAISRGETICRTKNGKSTLRLLPPK